LYGALKTWLHSFGRSIATEARRAWNPAEIVRAANETDSSRQRFIEWLDNVTEVRRGPIGQDRIEELIPRLRKVAVEDDFFDIAKPDAASEDVAFLHQQGTDLIVHGHTHSAKAYKLGSGLYLNSGTWGRLMRLPSSQATDKDWWQFLESLSAGRDDGVLRSTFVRVTHSQEEKTTTAALLEWQDGELGVMAQWRFVHSGCGWRQVG
jgi:hypothetical protein